MLVAREAELSLILVHAARARTHGLVTVAVRGEAGIGKTALLSAVTTALSGRGWQVLSIEADDLRRRIPYGAVIAGCRAFAGQTLYADRLRADAVRALDVLTVEPGTDPALWFGRAEEALTRLLTALVATGPLALALDDADRLDHDSAALLTALVRRLSTSPVAVLTTARPVHPPPTAKPDPTSRINTPSRTASHGELIREVGAAGQEAELVVEVGPLGVDALAAITAPLLGGATADSLANELHRRSDGNPLLALELARVIAERTPADAVTQAVAVAAGAHGSRGTSSAPGAQDLPRDSDPPVARSTSGPGPSLLRLSSRRALVHRFARLDDETAAVARAIAVLGHVRVDQLELLAAVTRLPEATVAAAFDALVGQDLLRRRDGAYGFTHELVREVLDDEAGPACRRLVHAAVARRMSEDRRRGVRLDLLELAWHVSESATPGDGEAVGILADAAALAKARAPERAVELTARALDLAASDDPRTATLLSLRCRALARTGRPAEAVEPGLAALAALPSGDDRSRTLTAVLGSLFSAGRTTEAHHVVDAELARRSHHPAVLRAQRALLLVFAGQDTEAAAEAARAEQALAADVGAAEAVVVHCQLAMVMSMLVRQDRLIEQADAALAAAGTSALLQRQALALGACATSLSGFAADATERLRMAEFPTDRLPMAGPSAGGAFGAEVLVARIAVDWLTGEWDEALRGIGRAGREARIGQQPLLAGAVRAIELDIRAWRGEPDHAAQLAAKAGPAARNMADLYALARANHLAELGETGAAIGVIDGRFAGEAEPPYACVLLARLVELELDSGRRPDTDRLVDIAADRPSPWAQAVLYRATGLAHADAKALRRSVEVAGGAGLAFERARSELALGMVDREAVDELTTAYRTFQRLGAHGLRRTAGARLRELGAKVPRTRSHRPGELTETEERMARLVQQGMRNREIATALHYSPRSVEVYLSRIYAKLGISSRLELARVLDGQGTAIGSARL